VTSELLMHVWVSLTGRGLRLIHARVRKAPPQFLPLGSPPGPDADNSLEEAAWEGRWSRQWGNSPSLPGRS
jgi:hypothetical protein